MGDNLEHENPPPQVIMPRVITLLSSLLHRVAESNDLNRPFDAQKVSVFHGLARPTISIQSYLERIFKYYNNAYYAKVGGISTREMNLLEVDFLFGLGFQLNVTPNTFHTYCCCLQTEMLQLGSPLNIVRTPKLHCCSSEDETTHQQQLAV
ncbi:hypothetical protein TEA_003400 [Camellia sinensis var. sinensis]|uniref:Cyclin n=1 Tax=Camellia sinensis var. sinensis TaxID=542762 RepID=A0A4S4EGY9_CAMSN|nr:hypothetical protein TEA_003400 [Camellia sinensis var. sinensis]